MKLLKSKSWSLLVKTKSLYLLLTILAVVACGQKDSGESTDGISSSQHRIFITSNPYQGDFGSISQANILCNTAARSAGLDLNYQAILSDSLSSAINSLSLVGSVYTFDEAGMKSLITENGADLWDNNNVSFVNPINRDEFGDIVLSSAHVWTGSNDTGYGQGDNCSNWGSDGAIGRYGKVGAQTFGEWLEIGSKTCSGYSHLYCISL